MGHILKRCVECQRTLTKWTIPGKWKQGDSVPDVCVYCTPGTEEYEKDRKSRTKPGEISKTGFMFGEEE